MKNKIVNKMRQRRDLREFQRALETASPTMRAELLAIAARQNTMLFH